MCLRQIEERFNFLSDDVSLVVVRRALVGLVPIDGMLRSLQDMVGEAAVALCEVKEMGITFQPSNSAHYPLTAR
ncbi:hypothetical protein ACLB2K_027120 [Fragaria x ananassa]